MHTHTHTQTHTRTNTNIRIDFQTESQILLEYQLPYIKPSLISSLH